MVPRPEFEPGTLLFSVILCLNAKSRQIDKTRKIKVVNTSFLACVYHYDLVSPEMIYPSASVKKDLAELYLRIILTL
jgi:hypothetical protein